MVLLINVLLLIEVISRLDIEDLVANPPAAAVRIKRSLEVRIVTCKSDAPGKPKGPEKYSD